MKKINIEKCRGKTISNFPTNEDREYFIKTLEDEWFDGFHCEKKWSIYVYVGDYIFTVFDRDDIYDTPYNDLLINTEQELKEWDIVEAFNNWKSDWERIYLWKIWEKHYCVCFWDEDNYENWDILFAKIYDNVEKVKEKIEIEWRTYDKVDVLEKIKDLKTY